ncbi:MAG: hypothetical protein DHS20C18_34690 [Saprospiraceae bacterium]|nr:MAG: hypothetical protein DHS20C18_34690 [Saprospiraceae bacterium]
MAKKQNTGTTNDEENLNTAPEAQTTSSEGTTNANDPSNSNPIDQVGDRFEEYNDQLVEHDIPNAVSDKNAKETDHESAQYLENYKICFYNEAKDTLKEYNSIQNRISTTLAKDAAIVRTEVDSSVTFYQDLVTALTAATAAIKAAKLKSNAADDAASIVDDARFDSTYSEEYKALKEGVATFDTEVDAIVKKADEVRDTADNAVEAAVKVHGIAGFSNVDGLQPAGENMKNGVNLLQVNINGNVSSSLEKKTLAQGELTTALENTSQSDHNLAMAAITVVGLEETSEFVQTPADPKPNMTLDDISKKVEETFLNQQ